MIARCLANLGRKYLNLTEDDQIIYEDTNLDWNKLVRKRFFATGMNAHYSASAMSIFHFIGNDHVIIIQFLFQVESPHIALPAT